MPLHKCSTVWSTASLENVLSNAEVMPMMRYLPFLCFVNKQLEQCAVMNSGY